MKTAGPVRRFSILTDSYTNFIRAVNSRYYGIRFLGDPVFGSGVSFGIFVMINPSAAFPRIVVTMPGIGVSVTV